MTPRTALLKCLYLAFSLAAAGCIQPDAATREFEDYLEQTFGSRPRNGTAYLMLSGNQCRHCVELDGSRLPGHMAHRLVVVTPLPPPQFRHLRLLHDRQQVMDRLRLLDYGSKLIIYGDDRILHLRAIDPGGPR